jgi:hypothetical protein
VSPSLKFEHVDSGASAAADTATVASSAPGDDALIVERTRVTMIQQDPARAVKTCTRALTAANALPTGSPEPRSSRRTAASETRTCWRDAGLTRSASSRRRSRLERPLAPNTFRGGERLGMIAMSYFNLGDFHSSDLHAGKAVATLKSVKTANDDEQQARTSMLQSMLRMRARFKRLHGDEIGALRLEREAEGLDVQER